MAIPTKTTPTAGDYMTSLLINAVLVSTFYAWQVHGSTGAGNLYIFLAWTMASLGLFIGVACCFAPEYATPRITWPAVWRWVDRARMAAMIASGAWLGHYVLALVLMAAVLMLAAARAELAKREVAP